MPKDQVEAHKQTGIDEFIFVGANVVQVINNILTERELRNEKTRI